jgi:protein-S-isoprenylcysteine O-methyltransferase Ste14
MGPLDWVAGAGLFVLLPIPLYWFIVHPFVACWRRMGRDAGLWVAGPVAWTAGGFFLFFFHERLLASENAPWWAVALGLLLIAVALGVFQRVRRELGGDRLVGKTEMAGGGELRTDGLYGRLRHPAYAAQMCTMIGLACLAGSGFFWAVAGVWWLLLLTAIRLEERELIARFGPAYEEYRRRVPAFLPLSSAGEAGK